MALYWDSASEAFVPLRADLIVGCLAALGLAVSVIVLWTRFPHYIRGKQLEQQTELAHQVQAGLLPSPGASFESMDFAAASIPAMQVGGDFYDAFSTGDGRVGLVVGDVSGKGLPAAVVVGLLLGAARASNWFEGQSEHEASCARLSELLRARTSLDSFVSLFSCCYEPKTRELRYVNAGHPPPILVRQSDGGGHSLERLEEGGPVLGVVDGAQYRQTTIALCPGDLLVLFTDGVAEASKITDGDSAEEEVSDNQFGEERLLETIRENRARSCTEIRDEILKRVHAFLGGSPAEDDLTLVVARVI
jgi:sigma-B regulation protein RsbU (phosphoserine phosphatase)